jgi:hypothetical protein
LLILGNSILHIHPAPRYPNLGHVAASLGHVLPHYSDWFCFIADHRLQKKLIETALASA